MEKVKVNYTLYNGKEVEVEVTTAQAKVLNELSRYERRNNRSETRRHQSLDRSLEGGFQIIDERMNLERDYIKREEQEYLYCALNKLSEPRRALIEKVFFKGNRQSELAENMGVTKAAVQNKLARIYKQLKKDLK